MSIMIYDDGFVYIIQPFLTRLLISGGALLFHVLPGGGCLYTLRARLVNHVDRQPWRNTLNQT